MGIPPNRSTLVPQCDAGLVGNQKLIQKVRRNSSRGFNAGLKADKAEPIIPATELPRLMTRMVQDKPDIRNSNLELMDRATNWQLNSAHKGARHAEHLFPLSKIWSTIQGNT